MPKIIIAAGLVIVENNKVLLNKHGDDTFWKFCGGRIKDYESDIKETAKREVKEEMGLEIEILNETPYFFYTEKEINGIKASVILIHFLAKRINEITSGKDIREWRWLNLTDLYQEDLAPNIKPALEYFGFIK